MRKKRAAIDLGRETVRQNWPGHEPDRKSQSGFVKIATLAEAVIKDVVRKRGQ